MALSDSNKNLIQRLGTAAVLVPVLIALIAWHEPLGWAGVVAWAVLTGLREFFTIVAGDAPGLVVPGVVLGGGLAAGIYLLPGHALSLLGGVPLLAFAFTLARPGELRTAPARVGLFALGVTYVAGLLTPLALLKRDTGDRGAQWIFLLLTIVWFGDTTAYAFGRLLGRHKLYPAVSPGKTVEGALGGLVGNVGAVVLARLWYMPELPWSAAAALAIPAGVLGQVGDLCESLLKRAYGVKDSGRVLPGHGGMLDRVDALMFAAPYTYLYARYLAG